MKQLFKSKSQKFFILITVIISVLLGITYVIQYSNHLNREKLQIDQFSKIIEAFNKRDYKILDKYIHPQQGILLAGVDGYYPVSYIANSLENQTLFTHSVFENLELGKVLYIGDGKFEKDGAFLSNFNSPYVESLNSEHNPLNEQSLKQAQKLELITNYKIEAVSNDHSKIYTFYFGSENEKNYLCAISWTNVPDASYLTNKTGTIPFENVNDVNDYLANKRFCNTDEESKDYIDFTSKSLQLPNSQIEDAIFYFSSFSLGEIEVIEPGKIKIRTVAFTNNDDESVKLVLTNKGDFISYGSGVNAQLNYTLCENSISHSTQISEIMALNVDSVIRNSNRAAVIEKIIKSNGNEDYKIIEDKEYHNFTIVNKKTKEEFRYVSYTESIQGHTFYVNMTINEIKNFYNTKGATVDESNYIRIECILIELKREGDFTRIEASWECD